MSFWVLYFIALLPLVVGMCFFIRNRNEFTWQEWVFNSILVFVFAGVFHFVAVNNAASDVETWSGQVVAVKRIPEWIESYRIQHTVHHSSGSGKNRVTWTTTYYTYHTARHEEHWTAATNLPNFELEIDLARYLEIKREFGNGSRPTAGVRHTWKDSSSMKSGDPYDYETANTTNVIVPVTNKYAFENRVKNASTLFSFAKVPENVVSTLPGYPINANPFGSDRLVGTARKSIHTRAFDEMNSRLGPTKQVNVVLVGLGDKPTMYAKYLESHWFGGKKNDVVIAYGGPNDHPDWVYAFGWTDRKTALRMVEGIVQDNGVSDKTLPAIETTIREFYKLKNWHDFDYIQIPVSKGWVIGFAIWTLVSQIVLMWWYNTNDIRRFAGWRNVRSWR